MTPQTKNQGNGPASMPEDATPEHLVEQVRDLAAENNRLQTELAELTRERDCYRKAVLKMLPQVSFEFDEAEVKEILAQPEKHQSMREFLRVVEMEFADHAE